MALAPASRAKTHKEISMPAKKSTKKLKKAKKVPTTKTLTRFMKY
jgi:hypothetical protein